MSFSMTVVIPKDAIKEERHFGTPIIVDGVKWILVGHRRKFFTGTYQIGAYVQCTKEEEPVFYKSTVSLTYSTSFLNVERFDINHLLSKYIMFRDSEVDKIGDHSYSVTVNVKLDRVGPTALPKVPSCQTVHPTGATDDQGTLKLEDLENRVVGLEKENKKKWSKIDESEQKCAKLEELVKKLEERLKVTEAYMENHQKLEEKTEALTNELEKTNVSEAESKEEVKHLKAELKVANQKVVLLQHVIVDTESTMAILEQKNKKLESAVKEKDEKISRLQGHCKDYLKDNNIHYNELKELKSDNEQLEKNVEKQVAENEQLKEKLQKMEKGIKEGIEYLKAELKVANQKAMEAEKKVELMQHAVVDTKNTMADLEQKNEKLEILLGKLEFAGKEKDEEIERLQDQCKGCLNENKSLHNQLKELNKMQFQQSRKAFANALKDNIKMDRAGDYMRQLEVLRKRQRDIREEFMKSKGLEKPILLEEKERNTRRELDFSSIRRIYGERRDQMKELSESTAQGSQDSDVDE